MFKSTNAKQNGQHQTASSSNVPGSQSSNSLVQGTRIEGNIFTENDIRIDGKLIGSLKSKGKVIVGPSGEIEGDVQCKNAVMEGRFNGLLSVSEVLEVKASAHVEGEIMTNKLIVQSGSTFNVSCKMGSQKIMELKGNDLLKSNDRKKPQAIELDKLAQAVG